MSNNLMAGYVTRTTPPSSPLDTLKALVLRNIDLLEYITDRLAGGFAEIPEDDLEFLDFIRQVQYRALAEHVPVAEDNRFSGLRHIHPDGHVYDDGTPVIEHWDHECGVMYYYPRYDGGREEALKRYNDWSAERRSQAETDTSFLRIVDGIEE